MSRRETGILGEELARSHLAHAGYDIVETNYRCTEGEIDIIARHDDYLVFVEVRTKTGGSFGSPEESVTRAKKDRLISVAWHYIQEHEKFPLLWRIDFVSVKLDKNLCNPCIHVIENAITG